jgi:hypothetical protein
MKYNWRLFACITDMTIRATIEVFQLSHLVELFDVVELQYSHLYGVQGVQEVLTISVTDQAKRYQCSLAFS